MSEPKPWCGHYRTDLGGVRCTAALEALADDAVLAASDVLDPKLAPVETLSTQFRAQVQRTPDAVSGPAAGGCAAGRVRGAADAGGADGRCRFHTWGRFTRSGNGPMSR
ncbi:hypothetical protein [Nocardia sp. NPDC059228]|uniref:hypothetical protein n=1 Tax=Nocardia sp. NPDC059228 TaxID=3346777 RepID=UPI003693A192